MPDAGFLGTRADFMTDVVMVAQVVIVPAITGAEMYIVGFAT